jgi:hypothetical protein
MRTDNDNARLIDRRRVLTGAGLAAGAAVAATAAGAGETVAGKGPVEPEQHAGYRETESVKTYYKLARF